MIINKLSQNELINGQNQCADISKPKFIPHVIQREMRYEKKPFLNLEIEIEI